MRKLLIPLLATISLPTAVNADVYTLKNATLKPIQSSYRTAKVNGSKDSVYATWKECWFDKDSLALLDHCLEMTKIYHCKTKLITFVGWESDVSMQNLKFKRGDDGDQACRKHFNFK